MIGISTSGNSKNVVNALKIAKEMGIKTLSLTGENGGLAEGFRRCVSKHRQRKPIGSRNIITDLSLFVRETEELFLENNTISPYIDDMRAFAIRNNPK